MFLVDGLHCHVLPSQTIYRHRSIALLPPASSIHWLNAGTVVWAAGPMLSQYLQIQISPTPTKTRWPISFDCWYTVYDAGPTLNQLVFAGQYSLGLYSANIFRYQFCPPQQRHVDQCWFNDVQPSTTRAQHWTNIWSTSCVCWVQDSVARFREVDG